MKVNEGVLDRSIRAFAGIILIALSITGIIGVWGYLGVIPLLTAAVGMCPLYALLGISTCPTQGT